MPWCHPLHTSNTAGLWSIPTLHTRVRAHTHTTLITEFKKQAGYSKWDHWMIIKIDTIILGYCHRSFPVELVQQYTPVFTAQRKVGQKEHELKDNIGNTKNLCPKRKSSLYFYRRSFGNKWSLKMTSNAQKYLIKQKFTFYNSQLSSHKQHSHVVKSCWRLTWYILSIVYDIYYHMIHTISHFLNSDPEWILISTLYVFIK